MQPLSQIHETPGTWARFRLRIPVLTTRAMQIQISCTTALLFFCCSIGTALSPNLAAFFVFRILTAFEGTAFLLVGSACLQ